MSTRVYSAQTSGLNGSIVEVEADVTSGLYSFSIVGLPDKAVEESKDRISAAIKNSGFNSPKAKSQKTVISLAPADIKKEGPLFDLPIALSFLLTTKQVDFDLSKRIFLGELSLNGEIRPVKGALLLAKRAMESGFEEIYVPAKNAKEAALIRGIKVFGCDNLAEVLNHFNNRTSFSLEEHLPTEIEVDEQREENILDFSDVKGQESAKRGLEIAAAGGHNILMVGPAGTGKTMLAKAFASLLPELSFDEILETTMIHSIAGVLNQDYVVQRPFRSPHHTSSYVSLVGGGAYPKPGEITLSHRGVLFLDEFSEFEKRTIEALRQPLEDGVINVSRAKATVTFPASFILVCAMNPCPCGNAGSNTKECVCSQGDLMRYQRKVSGPILDRIDLWIEVPQVDHLKLSDDSVKGETSQKIRKRVSLARKIQEKRFTIMPKKVLTNSEMGVRELKQFAQLSDNAKKVLNDAAKSLDLSGRAYHRVIKLARTIADLEGEDDIKVNHLFEALQYRPK